LGREDLEEEEEEEEGGGATERTKEGKWEIAEQPGEEEEGVEEESRSC